MVWEGAQAGLGRDHEAAAAEVFDSEADAVSRWEVEEAEGACDAPGMSVEAPPLPSSQMLSEAEEEGVHLASAIISAAWSLISF